MKKKVCILIMLSFLLNNLSIKEVFTLAISSNFNDIINDVKKKKELDKIQDPFNLIKRYNNCNSGKTSEEKRLVIKPGEEATDFFDLILKDKIKLNDKVYITTTLSGEVRDLYKDIVPKLVQIAKKYSSGVTNLLKSVPDFLPNLSEIYKESLIGVSEVLAKNDVNELNHYNAYLKYLLSLLDPVWGMFNTFQYHWNKDRNTNNYGADEKTWESKNYEKKIYPKFKKEIYNAQKIIVEKIHDRNNPRMPFRDPNGKIVKKNKDFYFNKAGYHLFAYIEKYKKVFNKYQNESSKIDTCTEIFMSNIWKNNIVEDNKYSKMIKELINIKKEYYKNLLNGVCAKKKKLILLDINQIINSSKDTDDDKQNFFKIMTFLKAIKETNYSLKIKYKEKPLQDVIDRINKIYDIDINEFLIDGSQIKGKKINEKKFINLTNTKDFLLARIFNSIESQKLSKKKVFGPKNKHLPLSFWEQEGLPIKNSKDIVAYQVYMSKKIDTGLKELGSYA